MSDHVYCRWLEGECFGYIGKCFNCEIRKKKKELLREAEKP